MHPSAGNILQLLTDLPGSASIATVVRVIYAKELTDHSDNLYTFYDLAVWSTVECGMALLASSLATLKPLFRKMNAIFTTTRQSSRSWGTANNHSTATAHNTQLEEGIPTGHRKQSSFSTYSPRKTSLSKVSKVSISVPQAVRWNHRLDSDEIAMIPRSPASDVQSALSSKPSFNKVWDGDMV